MVLIVAASSARASEPTKPVANPVDIDKPTATAPAATTPPAKDRLQKAMRDTAEALRSRTVEPAERSHFVELLNAAEALRHDEKVPQHERDKWRGLARVRLGEGADAMRRQLAQPASSSGRVLPAADAHVLRQVPAVGGAGAVPGATTPAADVVEAQKLIELITSTIRPETWEDNGGQGVIRYWSLGSALIIYNTADVHERLGNFTGQLRTP
jgi:hypothetical protein